jgi:hypothetical protein
MPRKIKHIIHALNYFEASSLRANKFAMSDSFCWKSIWSLIFALFYLFTVTSPTLRVLFESRDKLSIGYMSSYRQATIVPVTYCIEHYNSHVSCFTNLSLARKEKPKSAMLGECPLRSQPTWSTVREGNLPDAFVSRPVSKCPSICFQHVLRNTSAFIG